MLHIWRNKRISVKLKCLISQVSGYKFYLKGNQKSLKDFKQGSMIRYQRRQWHPTPVLLPGKSHGQRSLVGCSPWGLEEFDTTEQLHFHFSLSCIGEGNGNPLQCSCLENPRDRGAWWAAIYGVAQSWTQLKQLSGSMIGYNSPDIERWLAQWFSTLTTH